MFLYVQQKPYNCMCTHKEQEEGKLASCWAGQVAHTYRPTHPPRSPVSFLVAVRPFTGTSMPADIFSYLVHAFALHWVLSERCGLISPVAEQGPS